MRIRTAGITHLIQPFNQWNGRRQQRLHADAALPSECLSFQALRLALPGSADVKMQVGMRMRGDIFDTTPRLGGEDGDAELFDELALQGIENRFVRLDFSAREFPITGKRFAL